MQIKTLTLSSHIPPQKPNLKKISHPSLLFKNPSSLPSHQFHTSLSPLKTHHGPLLIYCIGTSQEVFSDKSEDGIENDGNSGLVSVSKEEENIVEVSKIRREDFAKKDIWNQIKEVVMFSGPATGLWICGPLMSLISTAVIGQGSSTELAALGPGTVFCDNMNLLFMFLPIATSNMVATSLAIQDKYEVQHQISILLFVGFACGVLMLLLTQVLGSWALTAFSGPKNAHIVPAASKYVQIRGLAWPAVLYGLVSQSVSLGMKDSWGPLKVLVVASVVNGIGHLVLCSFLGYGIEGAAWSTITSQVIAAYMMIEALNKKGYNAFAISIPSPNEFSHIFSIAAPVFVTMFSKVAFYTLMTYFATAMGAFTVAAHQVMIQMYGMCMACGEPLSQTAQSFMPEFLYGTERSSEKARMLLKSLVIIGAILGVLLASVGPFIAWRFPYIFTSDLKVIQEMHKVLILFFTALFVTPCTHSLEGTLLLVSSRGYGLPGCWCALGAFQWARFFLALQRLLSPEGILNSEPAVQFKPEEVKAA
ncbi:hypothetical protein DKX38_006328 [Salix brachista]|uniref:Protein DETOXIFICATION n=1 Tax=Salix brachista TaxID=2182728 RepID=A0A5N5N4H9_9ROSI|nr:hypothetical protein DKX38_006328 [Salix brachista]